MSGPAALPIRRVEHCMGTVFSFDVRSPGVDPRDLSAALAWLRWVDGAFSPYRPDSPISRIAAGTLRVDDADPRIRQVLAACRDLRDATDGAFDAEAGGRLDPSGYVKGWAIEGASDLLRDAGSLRHCINGGGDVQCIGTPEPGGPWRVGIADPLHPGRLAALVQGDGPLAVATSGTAERGGHIIDPRTGSAARYWASITVVGSGIARCDAYATAAVAMGPDAMGWLTARPAIRAFGIRSDGSSWATPGFAPAPASAGQAQGAGYSDDAGLCAHRSGPNTS